MLIKDVFNICNFNNVFNYIVATDDDYKLYSYNEKNQLFNQIKQVINECLLLQKKEDEEYNDFIVFISKAYDELDDTNPLIEYFDVFGVYISDIVKNKNSLDLYKLEDLRKFDAENKVTSYALDFIPRNILMYLEVSESSINNYGIDVCAAEIFKEITFHGFFEETVIKEENKLLEQIKEMEDNINSIEFLDNHKREVIEVDNFDSSFNLKASELNIKIRNTLIKEFIKLKNL